VDVKAIMGDSSDHIPGVPGVGEKGALKLIGEFGTLDGVYENLKSSSITKGVRAKLEAGRESAYTSRFLAKIVTDAPIGKTLEELSLRGVDNDALYAKFLELEFADLIRRFGLVPPSAAPVPAKEMGAELLGLDISKEAVRYAAGRYKNATWICASAAHLPVKDQSFGLITSLFALTMPEEFLRVLRPDGAFIQVLAAEDHLLGLKSIIYPELTHKEKQTTPDVPGFRLAESRSVRFTFTVEGPQVQNLLYMTPHVYRISKEGADRLRQTETLTDTASCVLNLYIPEKP
jgi:SAM-dependent methyltransferase